MSDFLDALVDLLPEHNSLKKSQNQLRRVLDLSVGEWFDRHSIQDLYDNLFLMNSTGGYLDCHGRDYGVYRQLNESDDAYRERIVQEKLDHLTPKYLKELYGLKLYVFVDEFDVTDNFLTSDNPYIEGVKMAEASSDIQTILNNKFVLNEEIIWLTNGAMPFSKDIPVTVYWEDNNDFDGNRPSSVTVKLYANNLLIDTETVSSSTSWETVFEDMPIYNQYGVKYIYKIVVDTVTDYDFLNIESEVHLVYNPELQALSVSKVWDDNDDQHQVRPDEAVMFVSANSHVYGRVTVNEESEWKGTVKVPVRLNKSTASYTWDEESITDYRISNKQTSGNNTVVTNTYWSGPVMP